MKLKLPIFIILLVVAAIVAYNFSSNSKVLDGVGKAVGTVGDTVSNIGEGTGLTTPENKKSTKNTLEPCTSNAECINNACGRSNAADGALKCCASGSITTYAGYDYCTQIPDGQSCWSDVMCKTGHCSNNKGGIQKGICQAKVDVSARCETNSDCKNNACGRATAQENTPLTCCASGKIATYGGYDYCDNMSDGATCWSDAMCDSGYCGGNMGGIQRGTCKSLAAAGQACSVNNDCANGACARASARDGEGLTCCASGQTSTYAGYDYCKNMPNGTTCWSDAMCKSGTCKGNMSGLKRGTCR